MTRRSEFVDHVLELADALGGVSARAMFGGWGIYADGVMFALVADEVLYLKTDLQSRGEFTARGLEPFTYLKAGKPTETSYYRAPEEALEDAEEMCRWGRTALEAAVRRRR